METGNFHPWVVLLLTTRSVFLRAETPNDTGQNLSLFINGGRVHTQMVIFENMVQHTWKHTSPGRSLSVGM